MRMELVKLKRVISVVMIFVGICVAIEASLDMYMSGGEGKIRTETVKEEMKKRAGMKGRLNIPNLDIDIALFDRSIYEDSQDIVDRRDSAAYLYGKDHVIIGDHDFQDNFRDIKKAIPHETIATIDYGDYIEEWICVDNFKGHNTGSELTHEDTNDSCYDENIGGIIMYTCNGIPNNVIITYWQKK